MGARGGAGIEIDVSHVPQRETGMTPYEIMLSESQERMLLVVKKGREAEVEAIFEKWDLHAAHIGDVTNDGLMRVKDHGEVVAEIPNGPLVDEAPVYDRPIARPAYLDAAISWTLDAGSVAGRDAAAPQDALLALLGVADGREQALGLPPVRPHGAHQHDRARRHGRRRRPRQGHDARAGDVDRRERPLLLPQSAPRRDARARRGGAQRRLRRRRCRSARTNCLNFGNPERPEIMWQLVEAIEGLAEACRALDIPITGGNVSLYNETDGQAIYPTPIIGVVGLIEDAARVVSRTFKQAGDEVVLLGESHGELGGSEYLKVIHGLVRGSRRRSTSTRARAHRAADAGRGRRPAAVRARLLGRRHRGDAGRVRFRHRRHRVHGRPPALDRRRHATLFGESASRAVVSVDGREPAAAAAVGGRARRAGAIDRAHGRRAAGDDDRRQSGDRLPVAEAEQVWSLALGRYFAGRAA